MRTGLKGAEAMARSAIRRRASSTAQLPPIDAEFVELDQLVRFVERPVRAFLRRRLGISVWDGDDEVEDALPVELDNLETWQVGDRLLKARLAGTDSKSAYRAEIARGTLPPDRLGEPVIRTVLPTVEDIVKHVPATSTTSVDVKVALPDGRTLRGTVPGVAGDTLLTVTYSRVNPRHRIAAWVRLLALTAAHPGRTFEAVTIGRPGAKVDASVAIARIAPIDPGEALDHLAVLLDLHDRGMREPPPLSCLTSAAYAAAARGGGDPLKAARSRVGVRPLPEGGRRARAPARARRAQLRRAARGGRARRRGRPVLGPGRVHPLRPLGAAPVDRAPAVRADRAPVTAPFDICGPLPTGVTVLEASAGTGKTYTIAALAARYVAAGVPLENLLLVTFTRMATGELRERVRERLVSAERALRTGELGEDRLARFLAGEQVALRRARLSGALADFDAATIATIHGFCQEVLGGLGIAGDVERDVEFLEDVSDLVEEVVDDLYVRRFHKQGEAAFTREEAGRIARLAVENPTAPIEPRNSADERPAMRARLADAVRRELDARKQRAAVMTYDDLLTRLDATLAGSGGPVVIRRLRERFKVVLVDEFQDTDPVQWSIVRQAFGDGTLVLIGDPKQAIYSFRGADVYAYLEAAREAATQATLDVNWRSDQGLIDAYDALFGGARLGHEGIVYRGVTAANAESRLRGAGAPLRIRVVHRDEPGIERTARSGHATAGSARAHVAKDLAADLVRLLDSDARVGDEPVRPGHVAVLVQTNRTAALVRDALDAVAIPAVINGAGSVFGTPPAREWLRLLEALERPTSAARAHAAALTPFFGWSAERIATATDEEWETVHQRLHDWARVLRLRGVASVSEAIMVSEGLPERVLRLSDGERRLTDLRHVGQLLHAEQLGTTALVAWLRRRIAEADRDTADEDRSRRLESDAEAVQVLTVHRSKGLEFPIVYYPYLWEPSYIPKGVPVAYHDPDAGDVRTIDVGLEGPDFSRHKQQELIEQRGEDLRLAYVALTRARHQAVVWWAGSFNSRDSAIGRLLFARQPDGTIPAEGRSVPTDAAATQPLRGAGGRGAGAGERRAVEARAAGVVERPPARAGRARGRAVRPRARPALAPDLVQRHHGGRARGAGEQRARGAPALRRARGGGAAVGAGGGRGAAGDPVAARGDAGGRARGHVRAPGARGDRLRRARPGGRAVAAGGRGAGLPARRDRRPGAGGRRACGRRSRRRSATIACGISRAWTDSTSSTSSCRWSAATRRRAGSRWTRSRTCCASMAPTCRPGSTTPRCATAFAAT